MEDVKKHYIFVLAGLVSLALSGCSSVQRTQEPTGDNRSEVVTREETTHDGMSEEPLVASSDLYLGYPSARSNSVWMSRLIVTEPIPQGIQGRVLQANNLSDAESSRPSKSSNRVTKRTESRKVTSQKSSTGAVGGASHKVRSGRSATQEPTVLNAIERLITPTENADGKN